MFGAGYRTPVKGIQISENPDLQMPEYPKENAEDAGLHESLMETESNSKVRKSIGEWERGNSGSKSNLPSPPVKAANVMLSKAKVKTGLSQNSSATTRGMMMTVTTESLGLDSAKPKGRVAEAKACLMKAKIQINSSRNLKAEIRTEVIQAVERLYWLVKEAEEAKSRTPFKAVEETKSPKPSKALDDPTAVESNKLLEIIEEQSLLIKRNLDVTSEIRKELMKQGENQAAVVQRMDAVKDQMTHLNGFMDQNKVIDGISYAAMAAARKPTERPDIPQAVHSVVVSSADTQDTSEDVLVKIRTAVSARTTGIRVDRLRKAKDQKVVLGCQSREEIAKVTERLKTDNPTLQIKEVENRDPLVIMLGVLNFNTDEDILGALKRQNSHILGSIPEINYRASVRFRKKARNSLESHVVLQVSPLIWRRLTEEGKAHIDLQRVIVKDQTPLLTCSRCLGYGHGRKTCQESTDTCSHCAGSHLRNVCPAWQTGDEPTCRNCQSARLDQTDHNSFDLVCPIRKKWDALARTRVAYC